MTPQEINANVLTPAINMLPAKMDSEKARCMLLTIGLQESRFEYRRQMNNGPAMGFWQFEKNGGVKGVANHPATRQFVIDLCEANGCEFTLDSIWRRLETDDVFAACLARLLLWTDPGPLPELADVPGSWGLYTRVWRPGKPHIETWPGNRNRAIEALK